MTDGPLFSSETKIEENWVQGNRHIIIAKEDINIDGKYSLMLQREKLSLEIKNSTAKVSASVAKDSVKLKVKASYNNGWLSLQLQNKEMAYAQLSGKVVNPSRLEGSGTAFNGESITWVAQFEEKSEEKEKKEKKEKVIQQLSLLLFQTTVLVLLNFLKHKMWSLKMPPFGRMKLKVLLKIPMCG